jgi:DNA-binding beta-propeller fold protein YncE
MSGLKKGKSSVLFVKGYVYVSNCGDGSASVSFFNTEQEAEAYAAPDDERFCDDIRPITIVVDPQTGKICNVKKRKED